MSKDLKFEITRVAWNQDDRQWVEVANGSRRVWISNSKYAESESYAIRRFNSIGVSLLSPATKTQAKIALENSDPNEKIFVAMQPGFVDVGVGNKKKVVGYAHASGEFFPADCKNHPEIVIGFDANPDFSEGGNPEIFQAEMGPLVKDQALPVLMLLAALAPILQPFVPRGYYVENMVIDLSGKGSKLKSAIMVNIAGAVWGGSSRKTGFFPTGNTTLNKVESKLPMSNHSLTGRDETTLLANNAADRGKALGEIIHRISSGETKDRMYEEDPSRFVLLAIFSSNQGLRSISSEDEEVLEALETRVLTVTVPQRETGAYDYLPRSCRSTFELTQKLYTLGFEHYGHLSRAMIKKTLQSLRKDKVGLQNRIGELMQKFMNTAGQNKLEDREVRSLKLIALCYAAGVLAKDWGVLDKKLFGRFEEPLLRAWTIARGGVAADDRDIFLQYLKKYSTQVVVIDNHNRPELSDSEFSATKAFILKRRDGGYLACFPAKRMPKRFPGFEHTWKRLRRKNQAIADAGSQSSQRIRLRNHQVVKDKVYALLIENWPLI